MTKQDDNFSSDHVDEQSEQFSDDENCLIYDLRRVYQPLANANTHSLDHVWGRIAQRKHYTQTASQQSEALTSKTRLPINSHTQNERISSMQNSVTFTSIPTHRLRHGLGTILTLMLLALLVGSLALVFNLASHRTFRGSNGNHPNNGTIAGATAQPPVKSTIRSTPGIYLISEDKNPGTYLVSRVDPQSHQVTWSTGIGQLGDFATQTLIVANNVVYVSASKPGASNNGVYALNASNGKQLWYATANTDALNGFLMPPTVADGTVYVACRNGKVYTFNAATGAKGWIYDSKDSSIVDGTVYTPGKPVVSNGVLYGSIHDTLFAVNAHNGKQLWSVHIDTQQIFSDPNVVGDTIYLSSFEISHHVGGQSQTGFVYAYNTKNGVQKWNFAAQNWVLSSPTFVDGVVYFGSYNANVYALKATNGMVLWTYNTGGEVYGSPLFAHGIIYVAESGNVTPTNPTSTVQPAMIAINAKTGHKIWSDQTTAGPVAIQEGVIYASDFPRLLITFDAANGHKLWQQTYGPDIIDKTGAHSGMAPIITVVP